ncbi:MAG: STAS domain-containing protein [Planctomycetes bacterium]|nr:STAS domain-containing protein [Planctomycetota bacterium]
MEIYYDEVDSEVLVVKADGGLNARTADGFVTDLEKLVDAGLRKIIVNCSSLNYISSYGLGILVRLHRRLARHGGNVKIASVKGVIVEVLRLTKLNTIFEIYPDVPRARLAFRPKTPSR